MVVKSRIPGFCPPRLFNLFEKIFFGEKNRIYPKIGLKGELGFYSKKGSKLGRELGEGEIWVKRVVLTALRAWLAVVIYTVHARGFSVACRLVGSLFARTLSHHTPEGISLPPKISFRLSSFSGGYRQIGDLLLVELLQCLLVPYAESQSLAGWLAGWL